MVSLRPGNSTHDDEFNEDQDAFLQRCEDSCGSIFTVLLHHQTMTVVSGPLIREVFMHDNMSSSDALEEFAGMNALFNSMIKSNHDIDHRTIHALVRDYITPNLSLFTPKIVEQLERNLEQGLGACLSDHEAKLVENPLTVLQGMVASASMSPLFCPKRCCCDGAFHKLIAYHLLHLGSG